MRMKKFDVVIIGGGCGAKLASSLAERGLHIAVIDQDALGGTCLNHGCIPSKMLIHSAEIAKKIKRAKKFNLEVGSFHCDFKELVQRVTQEITHRSHSMERAYEKDPRLEYFHGKAKFLTGKVLEVKETKLTADKIFIASGAHPFIPSIPGLRESPYLTSKEALRLKKQPQHLVIIGGGYIAAELGFFYSTLGSKVTLLIRNKMLSREDRDLQEEFHKIFGKSCSLLFQTQAASIEYQQRTFRITCKGKHRETLEADQLLVATGIRGSTQELQLENTQVKTDKHGFIQVNRCLRTKEKQIWALGDVIGAPFFRHKANFEAEYLLQSQFEAKKSFPISYPPIPHAIFSYPQIAGVGKTEKSLRKEKIPYFVGKHPYEESGRGLAIQPEGGFVKLLFARKTGQLLGAHIIGEEASSLCHIPSAFLQTKGNLQDLLSMIYIHPSLPEVIKKAAQNADNRK